MNSTTPIPGTNPIRSDSGKPAILILRTVVALLAALPAWSGTALLLPVSIFGHPSCACAAGPEVHGVPLEEAVDFYQYTDHEGTVHFVDGPEKIPRQYRDKVIIRKETHAARQTTKVRIIDRQIHVPVTLKRGERVVPATLLLDTGSSVTIITTELAGRLGIDPQESRPGTIRLADGREVDIRLVQVDAVVVGFRRKAPLEIGIVQHIGSRELHDGLLGLDFLGDFQYQVDLANEMIRWQ
jgi:predicted aspartyl protease